MYTLVVVDMQPKFAASRSRRCIANCIREVQKAIVCGAHIIVLEYSRRGNEAGQKTTKGIRQLVKAYEHGHFITKGRDDGSDFICYYEGLYNINFNKNFVLCGVNLGACVKATALGLKYAYPNCEVSIVADAVNQPKDWLYDYPGHKNTEWEPKNILHNLNIYHQIEIL